MAARNSTFDAGRFSELVADAHDDRRIALKHGEPLGDIILPFVRVDGVTDAVSTMANAVGALVSERGTTPLRALVALGNYSFVVCIQLYQTDRHTYASRLDTVFQGEPFGKREGVSHPCAIYNLAIVDEIPSEHDVHIVTLLMHWYLEKAIQSNRKPLFMIGCQQGLNRTGFLIAAALVRLFGVPIERAIRLFRKAHYPGIVKQHFIDQLYARYAGVHGDPAPTNIFSRMPMAYSLENIVHRTLKGESGARDRPIRAHQRAAPRIPLMSTPIESPPGTRDRHTRVAYTHWCGGERLIPSVAHWLYEVTLPRILERVMTCLGEPQPRQTNMVRPFRNGFVRPLPCATAELDRHDADVVKDCDISIKANGRHASLVVSPVGVFVVERFDGRDVRSLPCLFVSDATTRLPLKLTVLECELVETPDALRVYAFDILYSEDALLRAADGGPLCAAPFDVRRERLAHLFSINVLRLDGARTLIMQHKPFYPLTSKLLQTLRTGGLDGLFDPFLCDPRGNDGFIVSRRSANVLCRLSSGSTQFPHMKLKEAHTVDVLLALGGRGVAASFAHTGGMGTFGTTGFNHVTLDDGTVLHYDATLLNAEADTIHGLGGPGLYECVCVVTGKRFGFRVGHRRTDIHEPNRLVPTIKSCLALTKEGFYLDALDVYMRRRLAERKRRRDSSAS